MAKALLPQKTGEQNDCLFICIKHLLKLAKKTFVFA